MGLNRVIQSRRSDEGKVGQNLNLIFWVCHMAAVAASFFFLHESETEIQNSIKNMVSKNKSK